MGPPPPTSVFGTAAKCDRCKSEVPKHHLLNAGHSHDLDFGPRCIECQLSTKISKDIPQFAHSEAQQWNVLIHARILHDHWLHTAQQKPKPQRRPDMEKGVLKMIMTHPMLKEVVEELPIKMDSQDVMLQVCEGRGHGDIARTCRIFQKSKHQLLPTTPKKRSFTASQDAYISPPETEKRRAKNRSRNDNGEGRHINDRVADDDISEYVPSSRSTAMAESRNDTGQQVDTAMQDDQDEMPLLSELMSDRSSWLPKRVLTRGTDHAHVRQISGNVHDDGSAPTETQIYHNGQLVERHDDDDDDSGGLFCTEATPTPVLSPEPPQEASLPHRNLHTDDSRRTEPPQIANQMTTLTNNANSSDRTNRYFDRLQTLQETCAQLRQSLTAVPQNLRHEYLSVHAEDEERVDKIMDSLARLQWGANECKSFDERMRARTSESRSL